jgi:chemotaxis protein methyltransferase CheR
VDAEDLMDARDEDDPRPLLDAIHARFHYDFREYSQPSVRRRLTQALVAFDCATFAELEARVLGDPVLFPALLQYLTVQVSDLFRDPSYFCVFRERIVPVLRTYPSLKVWVAGCSTGEELWSFAILLREEGLLDKTILYATDINGEALRVAEAGIYPLARMKAFTANHRASGAPCSLSSYYTANYGSAVFDRSLRRHVVFSDHSLATDAVFGELQVVSCRNVLIYFERTLQDRAVSLFRGSLCTRGFLGLGARESLLVSEHEADFTPFAPEDRWYRRR